MSGHIPQQIRASRSSDRSVSTMVHSTSFQTIQALNASTERSNVLKIICIILVFFAVGAVVFSIGFYEAKKSGMLNAQKAAELDATEVKHITPQPYILENNTTIENEARTEEDSFISFSLFTTPPGAEVYADSAFIGTTPIEQRRMKKSNDSLSLIVSLDGYEIVRKKITLSDNFSDAVSLTEVNAAVSSAKLDSQPIHASDSSASIHKDEKVIKKNKRSDTDTSFDGDIVLPD